MSEVQIAIIDEQDTQIALAVPGIQGPAGAISSGGSANQVFYKVSGTNYDAGWTFIGNANVDAAAAIAGTKISPNFGSQATVTTGTNTAASFIPTSATIPSNGIYLPGANQVGVATNGTGRLFINASGVLAIGAATSGSPTSVVSIKQSSNTRYHGLWIENSADDSGIGIGYDTTPDCFSYSPSYGTTGAYKGHAFYTSNLERLRITAAGLVGIGTSSPGSNLEVVGGTTSAGPGAELRLSSADQTIAVADEVIALITFKNNDASGGMTGYMAKIDAASNRIFDGDLASGMNLRFFAGTAADGVNTPPERMRLTSAGRLGIGTTGPQGRFESAAGDSTSYSIVANNSYSTGDQNYISLTASTTQIGSINRVTNDIAIKSNYDGIVFWTGTGGTATQKAKIDSSGRLLIGTSTARSNFYGTAAASAALQIEGRGGTGDSRRLAIISSDNFSTAGGNLVLAFQRSGAVGGNTIVQSGDLVGTVTYLGNDGTNFVTAASIQAEVDGTPGANDMPGRLVFSTTPDSGSSPTSSPPAMTIKSSQEVLIGTSTITANGGILQLKSGITFPATAVAASDANTLDDYEEGTWTPALSFGGGTTGITYDGFTAGRYTKIGRLVTLHGTLKLTNKGTSTGNVLLTGFPFPPGNVNANYAASSINGSAAITYTGTLGCSGEGGNSHARISSYTEAGVLSYLTDTNFANNSEAVFTITYTV